MLVHQPFQLLLGLVQRNAKRLRIVLGVVVGCKQFFIVCFEVRQHFCVDCGWRGYYQLANQLFLTHHMTICVNHYFLGHLNIAKLSYLRFQLGWWPFHQLLELLFCPLELLHYERLLLSFDFQLFSRRIHAIIVVSHCL